MVVWHFFSLSCRLRESSLVCGAPEKALSIELHMKLLNIKRFPSSREKNFFLTVQWIHSCGWRWRERERWKVFSSCEHTSALLASETFRSFPRVSFELKFNCDFSNFPVCWCEMMKWTSPKKNDSLTLIIQWDFNFFPLRRLINYSKLLLCFHTADACSWLIVVSQSNSVTQWSS